VAKEVIGVPDLTLRYEVVGATTVLTVEGMVEAHRCRALRDGLEMALALRRDGPIVVDLRRVDRLAAAAVLILRRAADDARRTGRTLTVRDLRLETISDPRSLHLLRDLWSAPIDDRLPATSRRHVRHLR